MCPHFFSQGPRSALELNCIYNFCRPQKFSSNVQPRESSGTLSRSTGQPWLAGSSPHKATCTSTKAFNRERVKMSPKPARDDTPRETVESQSVPTETTPGQLFVHSPQGGLNLLQEDTNSKKRKQVSEETETPKTDQSSVTNKLYQEPESAQALHTSNRKLPTNKSFQSQQSDKINEARPGSNIHVKALLRGSGVSKKNMTGQDHLTSKITQQRYEGQELSFSRARLSQLSDAQNTAVRGRLREMAQLKKTGGLLQIKVDAYDREVHCAQGRPDNDRSRLQNLAEQYQPKNAQLAVVPPTDECQLSSNFTNPDLKLTLAEQINRPGGGHSQTARLHALTSSLAVKTSTKRKEPSLASKSEVVSSNKNRDRVSSTLVCRRCNPPHTLSNQPHPSPSMMLISEAVSHDKLIENDVSTQETLLISDTSSCSPINGMKNLPDQSGGYSQQSHCDSVDTAPTSSLKGSYTHMTELRFWVICFCNCQHCFNNT